MFFFCYFFSPSFLIPRVWGSPPLPPKSTPASPMALSVLKSDHGKCLECSPLVTGSGRLTRQGHVTYLRKGFVMLILNQLSVFKSVHGKCLKWPILVTGSGRLTRQGPAIYFFYFFLKSALKTMHNDVRHKSLRQTVIEQKNPEFQPFSFYKYTTESRRHTALAPS